MTLLAKGSLKGRLIGGFFICAILTALSGGTGIFSLKKIQTVMGETTRLVSNNIDDQNRQIRQLMPVRDLVNRTLDAGTLPEIKGLRTQCRNLADQVKGTRASKDTQAFKSIYTKILDLIETKTRQLSARQLLGQSLNSINGILEEITRLTNESIKKTQAASVESVEKKVQDLSQMLSTRTADPGRDTDPPDMGNTLDELMMTSEMSISAVGAAISVQAVTIRQQVLTNTLYHAAAPDALDRIEKGILDLQSRINNELVELPEDGTTENLKGALDRFSNQVRGMFDRKKEELKAEKALQAKAGEISTAISSVELALMTASGQVKSNVDKAMATSGSLIRNWQTLQAVLAAAAMVLALGIGFFVSTLIIRPVTNIIGMLKDIARGDGDLTVRLDSTGKDEMAEMARWFNLFVEKIQTMIKAMAQNTLILEKGSKNLLSLAETLSQGAARTSGTAENLLTSARETSGSMEAMENESREASTSIQAISAAVEQMTVSVEDIAKTAAESGRISEKAVDESRKVQDQVHSLNLSALDIGKVTQVIREISEQTHLLALNATIEAARAGEAGKGFTVVANEIKDLADQTSTAIGEIKNRVEAIQSSAQVMDQGIGEVSATISRTNASMATIISAVEEQSATTREIAGNLTQASRGICSISDHISASSQVSKDITRDMAGVSRTAQAMDQDSVQVRANAEDLTGLARTLKEQADQFAT